MNQILSKRKSWQASLTALLLIGISQWIFVAQTPAKQIQSKAQENQSSDHTKIRSATVHVIGESFIGVQYSKQITVTSVDSQYMLSYSCFRCKCPKVERKKLEPNIAEEFLKLIESLEDGGRMASCCDHPYTEVEIAYRAGSVKKMTLSFDLAKSGRYKEKEIPGVEKVLNLECDGIQTPVAGSVENELKGIITHNIVPADLTITYDDIHGLWGGTTITIYGNGRLERQIKSRSSSEATITRKRIDRHELIELVGLLVKLRAWDQITPDRPPKPDESRANLTISVKGSRSSIWEWYNEMRSNNRLIQIRDRMIKKSRATTARGSQSDSWGAWRSF